MAKILSKIIYYGLMVLIMAVALLFIISVFPITGNYQTKIVLSGSMEPAIKTGSVIVIKPQDVYEIGEVITFGQDTKTQIPTTHRITEMRTIEGKYYYTTKGDANDNSDFKEINEDLVIGKVLFSIPYLGFVLDFVKKPTGFILLVIIPALIIAIDEIKNIWKEVKKFKKTEL
ncbi:signal peptidase I [Candidatus Parcubacteria bacterium]|nr:signal peptidase I [Candidatus Parcubacteria bacterium]